VSNFDRYYDTFLQNSMRGRPFQIVVDGERLVGVPTAGSVIDPSDPDASFNFHDQRGSSHRIRFADLEDARPIPATPRPGATSAK
jgi:hypothetical protein